MLANTKQQPAALTGTRASGSSTLLAVARVQRLHPPQHRLAAVGHSVPTCPAPMSDRLASFSLLTGSFTPWAGAPSTEAAASLPTRLSTIRWLTVGLPSQLLIPTIR